MQDKMELLKDSQMTPAEVLQYITQTAVMMGDSSLILFHRICDMPRGCQNGYMANSETVAQWAVDFYEKYGKDYNAEANDHETPWEKDYPDCDWDVAVEAYALDRIKEHVGEGVVDFTLPWAELKKVIGL